MPRRPHRGLNGHQHRHMRRQSHRILQQWALLWREPGALAPGLWRSQRQRLLRMTSKKALKALQWGGVQAASFLTPRFAPAGSPLPRWWNPVCWPDRRQEVLPVRSWVEGQLQ